MWSYMFNLPAYILYMIYVIIYILYNTVVFIKRIMSLWLCLQMLLSESLQKVFAFYFAYLPPSIPPLPPSLPTSSLSLPTFPLPPSLPLIGSNTLITLTKFPFWIRFVFNGCLMLCGEIYQLCYYYYYYYYYYQDYWVWLLLQISGLHLLLQCWEDAVHRLVKGNDMTYLPYSLFSSLIFLIASHWDF